MAKNWENRDKKRELEVNLVEVQDVALHYLLFYLNH
jgi:hypothetical protein